MKLRAARHTDLYLLDHLAGPDDDPWVIHVAAFLARVYGYAQEAPERHLVVFDDDAGDLVGAAYFERSEPGVWYLSALCLFPECRGEGRGTDAIGLLRAEITSVDSTARLLWWKRHEQNRPMERLGAKLGASEVHSDGVYVSVHLPW